MPLTGRRGVALLGVALVLAACTGSRQPTATRTPATTGLSAVPLPPLTVAQARRQMFGDMLDLGPTRDGDVATVPEARALAAGTGPEVTATLVRLTAPEVVDTLAWAVVSRSADTAADPPQECFALVGVDASTGGVLARARSCRTYDAANDPSAGSLDTDSGQTSSNLQKRRLLEELGLHP